MTTTQSFKATIDVCHIIPGERHPLIFSTFDHLGAGEALLLFIVTMIASVVRGSRETATQGSA